MNKKVQVQDLGLNDYKATWDYQEQLFQETLDLKIRNRREELNLDTPNHFLFSILKVRNISSNNLFLWLLPS